MARSPHVPHFCCYLLVFLSRQFSPQWPRKSRVCRGDTSVTTSIFPSDSRLFNGFSRPTSPIMSLLGCYFLALFRGAIWVTRLFLRALQSGTWSEVTGLSFPSPLPASVASESASPLASLPETAANHGCWSESGIYTGVDQANDTGHHPDDGATGTQYNGRAHNGFFRETRAEIRLFSAVYRYERRTFGPDFPTMRTLGIVLHPS